MQGLFNKAYKDIVKAVDNFANCSAGTIVAQKQEPTVLSGLPRKKLNYVYPYDSYIDSIIESKIANQALRTFVNQYSINEIYAITKCGTQLNQNNYPRVWSNFRHCCSSLSVEEAPKLFITSWITGINALSLEIENNPVILLSYKTAVLLNDSEQRFLIGHELGHIQQGHLLVHALQGVLSDLNQRVELLGTFVADLVELPLKKWFRASEFTADRAGYLCCKNVDDIVCIFNKVQEVECKTGYTDIAELYVDHPMLKSRINEIRKFSISH